MRFLVKRNARGPLPFQVVSSPAFAVIGSLSSASPAVSTGEPARQRSGPSNRRTDAWRSDDVESAAVAPSVHTGTSVPDGSPGADDRPTIARVCREPSRTGPAWRPRSDSFSRPFSSVGVHECGTPSKRFRYEPDSSLTTSADSFRRVRTVSRSSRCVSDRAQRRLSTHSRNRRAPACRRTNAVASLGSVPTVGGREGVVATGGV